MNDFSIPKLKELDKAMNERLELVKDSLKNASNAEEDMGTICLLLLQICVLMI